MPTYTVVSPDSGKTYEVEAPDGATPAEIKARVRFAEKRFGYRPKDILQAKWAQELMMSGSDEVSGAVAALHNMVSSIVSDARFEPAAAYEREKSAELARVKLAEEMYPAASAGLTGLSFLAGGATPALKEAAAATRSIPALIKEGAKTGAKMGAISGFLSGEDSGRLYGAAGGAGIGSLLGGLTPAAFMGTAKGYRWLKEFFGGDPNAGMRYLQQVLQREGLTKTRAVEAMTEMADRGSPVIAADVSPGTARAFATQSRMPSRLSNAAKSQLRERQAGQGERIKTAISENIGPIRNVRKQEDMIVERAKANASPHYEAAYSGSGGFSDETKAILNTPAGKDALSRAYRIAANERRDPKKLGFDIERGTNEVILTKQPSMQTLDYVKRGLDDVINSYRDRTSGRLNLDEEGRAVLNLQKSLTAELDKANPDYAKARSIWGGEMASKNAMLDGVNAINDTADDIEYRIQNYTPNELEMFKLGFRKAMADVVDKGGDFADKVRSLAGTEKKRQVLQTLFGQDANFGNFMDKLSDESKMAATYANATGNSETASRLLEAMDFAGGTSPVFPTSAAAGLRQDIGGITGAALNFVRQSGLAKTTEKAQNDLLTILSQSDPAKVSELLKIPYRVGAENRALEYAQAKLAASTAPYMGILAGLTTGPAVTEPSPEEQPVTTGQVPDYEQMMQAWREAAPEGQVLADVGQGPSGEPYPIYGYASDFGKGI